MTNLMSQKMGIHEWSYDNDTSQRPALQGALGQGREGAGQHQGRGGAGLRRRHRLQGSPALPQLRRADRVHRDRLHRVRRLRGHLPDGLHHASPPTASEADLRTRLKAPALNLAQDLYVSGELKTGRVMVKDEDVCLHCGLCAERCPTGAWDMQKFLLKTTPGGPAHAATARGGRLRARMQAHRSGQRLRHQVRQRQRLGLGLGQRAVRQGHPAHGRAGQPAQHLPEQHPGPADLVRGARDREGLPRAGAAAST